MSGPWTWFESLNCSWFAVWLVMVICLSLPPPPFGLALPFWIVIALVAKLALPCLIVNVKSAFLP